MKHSEFVDENNTKQRYYMGCYGIGIGRTLATIVELNHDEHGIIWPISVSPYQVHVVSLDEAENQCSHIVEVLEKGNIEVLWDERNVQAGVKFKDADLIGIPIRIVVSKKTLAQSSVEVKLRSSDTFELVKIDNLQETVMNHIANLSAKLNLI